MLIAHCAQRILNMNKIYNYSVRLAVAASAVLIPTFAYAADLPTCDRTKVTLACVVLDVIKYLNLALYLFMAIAIVFFVYHVIKYFILPNDSRKEAGSYVLFSIIGFFVILSVWGIVNIVAGTFGLNNTTPQTWSTFTNIFPR